MDNQVIPISLGKGIFMWRATERQSQRYGFCYFSESTFNNDVHVAISPEDINALQFVLDTYQNLRVRLKVKVLESRESGHAGDLYIDVIPQRPEVGEVVDLGVGILVQTKTPDGQLCFGLAPLDNRAMYWIEPRKLYRLHDQTVEVFLEETTDEPDPAPQYTVKQDTAIANGDGTLQTLRPLAVGDRVVPHMRNLGGGMVAFNCGFVKGETIEIIREGRTL